MYGLVQCLFNIFSYSTNKWYVRTIRNGTRCMVLVEIIAPPCHGHGIRAQNWLTQLWFRSCPWSNRATLPIDSVYITLTFSTQIASKLYDGKESWDKFSQLLLWISRNDFWIRIFSFVFHWERINTNTVRWAQITRTISPDSLPETLLD